MMAFLAFLLAAILATVLGSLVRRLAIRHGFVVPPRSDRWHREPTATLGGIAIAGAAFAVAGLLASTAGQSAGLLPGVAVMAAALAMFAVGLADDRLQLSPLAKLVASLVIGAVFVFALGAREPIPLPWLYTVAAIVWFGGMVHAWNLLDNMDGLAAGVGIVSAAFLAWTFAGAFGPPLVLFLLALAGALAGFLVWNRRPARLFMGDCGSLFLGAALAGASLVPMLQADASIVVEGLFVALILVVPLLDTGFVLVLRRLAGRSATRGGTDHVSHRLVSLGFSERSAVRVLYALNVLGGVTALLIQQQGDGTLLPLGGLFVVGVMLMGVYLARVPAYEAEDFLALQKSSFAPFLRDLAFRWHAGQVLLDVALIAIVYYASYRLRFGGDRDLPIFMESFRASLPVVLACKLFALYVSGLYLRSWATFGLSDLYAAVRGVGLGSVLSILAVAYVYRFEAFSRGVFLIDTVLLFAAVLATRTSFRLMSHAAISRSKHHKRVLIYGAGSGGQLLVREMRSNTDWSMNPVGFIDDDLMKHKLWILGVPVRGGFAALESALARYQVDELLLSSLAINGTREEQIRTVCGRLNVPVRRLHFEIH